MNSQPHIRLFDQVEIALNVVGSKFKPSVEPDGTIYFTVLNSEGEAVAAGRVTFNVFWSNQRHNRALFDREILEQLIVKNVQEYQNSVSLLPIRIERVELDELKQLQENAVDEALAHAHAELGPLTELGRLGQFCASIPVPAANNGWTGFTETDLDQSNAYIEMQSKPSPLPVELTAVALPGESTLPSNVNYRHE